MALNLLPEILARRSQKLLPSRALQANTLPKVEREIDSLEKLLRQYQIDFPFFFKVDAWKSYSPEPDYDLWILERIGWGRWNDEYRVLFAIEGLPIPKMDDAEVVSVNSASPPFLTAARELKWTDEVLPEEVQAAPIETLPYALKEKVYPHLDEFILALADTIDQMEAYDKEFQEYLEYKIQEYLDRYDNDYGNRSDAIQSYFRSDRRVELFYEFLESLESNS